MHFVQVSAQLQSVTKKIGANKNCTISGWQDVNDLMHKFFGVFQKKFLETIWYIGLKFSEITEIVLFFQYSGISFY